MSSSQAEYVRTEHDCYLQLYSNDGTYRAVFFDTEEAAGNALRSGRAELDEAAIAIGLMPMGAHHVSRAAVSPRVAANEPDALTQAMVSAAGSKSVTPRTDKSARTVKPGDAVRYLVTASSMYQIDRKRANAARGTHH